MTCRYHDWVIVGDYPDASKEVCRICSERKIWSKVGGKIDNASYLRSHVRDFCQPVGPTAKIYEEIYGTAALNRSLALRRRKEHEAKEKGEALERGVWESKEALRYWKRAAGQGHTEKEILAEIEKIK